MLHSSNIQPRLRNYTPVGEVAEAVDVPHHLSCHEFSQRTKIIGREKVYCMLQIPIAFPSDVERLRRAIEADRALSYKERIQALDGILNAIDLFRSTAGAPPGADRLREIREEEGHRSIREFIQRQLARDSADSRTAD